MFDDFMLRAMLAGIGTAVAAAPLGCFVIWRRMAYFGDATANAALLGVALSFALHISVTVGVLVVAVLIALLVSRLQRHGHTADALLGVFAHASLAFGLVAMAMLDAVNVDLDAYLFGDILAIDMIDLLVIACGLVLVTALMLWRWSSLLVATLNPDLACAEGVDPEREQLFLTLAIAVVVAMSIKVVGALLITALLIIPAAAARPCCRTPEQMVLLAAAIGATSSIAGLAIAYQLDTPAAPSIVCVASVLFATTTLLTLVLSRRRSRNRPA